jgi:uncharacterized membrane protein YfcA
MENETVQAFVVGAVAGAMIGGIVGFYYGRFLREDIGAPQYRMVIATVIVIIWGLSQTISIAFGTTVDPWLNAIMGAVAGFLFGDSVVESIRKK